MNSLDVGIVGGGTAGTAAGLLLARAGHRVTLYERVLQPAPLGAGIVLQPTGQAVLRRLGLWPRVLERGARIDRLRCIQGDGRPLFDLDYGTLGPDTFGLGLHRGVLFETLLQAARDQAGLEVRCGVDVVGTLDDRDHVHLDTADGQRLGPHDLVVVADGARSVLRLASGLPFEERPYAWGALWFIAQDPQPTFSGELLQIVRGTSHMLGLLPTGRGPAPGSPPQVSLFWSLRADALAAFREAELSVWKEAVLRDEPRAAAALDQLHHPEQLVFARYRRVMMPRWHGERVVLLGDAAHAMSPQLGQGCNLALVDAAVLADAVARAPWPRVAVDEYTRARRAHLRYYQLATWGLTPLFQSNHAWLGWARDRLMPLAARMPWVRRRMCASMAGQMRGVLRAPLPLASLEQPAPPALHRAPDGMPE